MQSESIVKLSEALVRAQKVLKPAPFNSENPFFKKNGKATRYADLNSVIETSRVISEYGLCVLFMPRGATLVTRLQHSSGEFIESEMTLLLDKQTMQGTGSALTYAKRFSLSSMLCMICEDTDDDGNSAEPGGSPNSPKGVVTDSGSFTSFSETAIPSSNTKMVDTW